MKDFWNRTIEYARFSLTEGCNFSCVYCQTEQIQRNDKLTLEEQQRLLQLLSHSQIQYLRFTGGEPTVSPHLLPLVAYAKEKGLFKELMMTTNGSLLSSLAKPLKAAGLDKLNISLDTLDEARFFSLTGGKLKAVLQGIEEAKTAGFTSIKVNTVLWKDTKEEDLHQIARYGKENGLLVRFIEYMPFTGEQYRGMDYSTWLQMMTNAHGPYESVETRYGHGPAQYVRFADGLECGYIFPITNQYCHACNRIRITADGKLRLCLLQGGEISLRPILRERIEKGTLLLKELLQGKPKEYEVEQLKEIEGMKGIGG